MCLIKRGQVNAKDLIIKDQNKKYEAICVELENYKLKSDSLFHRQSNAATLKRDLVRKDDLLKTYKAKLESVSKVKLTLFMFTGAV